MSFARKVASVTLAPVIRTLVRGIAHVVLPLRYTFELDVDPRVYDETNGAVVAAKHVSYLDAPILMHKGWSVARLRPIAKRAEYKKWRYVMAAFDAIPTTPNGLHRGQKTTDIASKVLATGKVVLIFPGGTIVPDGVTSIHPIKSRGVYDMLQANPDKPLVMVTTHGLGSKEVPPPRRSWWRRHVKVTVRMYHPDLSCGLVAFNQQMEDHFNHGTPMREVVQAAASQ